MAKLTPLVSILSGFMSATKLSTNFSRISDAFDNTLSRDGSSPNAMEADLDLNSNRILNLADPVDPSDAVSKGYLDATLESYDFADGEQGEVGPQGPQGEIGPQGPAGNDGAPGAPGTAATISVGTVTTGAAGSSATITNAGTTSAAVFNFTIPRGDTGASGAGSGDVIGPASSTDNGLVRYDGTTGKLLQASLGWSINDSGYLLASADNTYDIGASGATRPRTIYAGTSLNSGGTVVAGSGYQVVASGYILFNSRTEITAPSDGALNVKNNAGTNTNFSVDASGNGVFRGSSVTVGGTAVSLSTHTHTYASLTSIPASIDAIDGLTPAADRLAYYDSSSTAALATLTTFGRSLIDDADAATARTTIGAAPTSHTHAASDITDPTSIKSVESLVIAVSDETTAITTGTAKVTFRMPYAFTLTAVRASLTTASSSGIPTIDINEAGTTILSTKLTIDASEKTSTTAATAAVISDTSLADDAEITIDIDVAGTGAAGLKVYLIGRRT